jgi:hypothetical protein
LDSTGSFRSSEKGAILEHHDEGLPECACKFWKIVLLSSPLPSTQQNIKSGRKKGNSGKKVESEQGFFSPCNAFIGGNDTSVAISLISLQNPQTGPHSPN